MREILFRGQTRRIGEKVKMNGDKVPSDWVYGGILQGTGVFSIIYGCNDVEDKQACNLGKHTVYTGTIGQYTGLTDKNGKKIFEGDICRFREWNNGDMCWIGKVHYEHLQFVISGDKNKECEIPFTLPMSRFVSEDIEVIGNIYDNPELLEVSENA